MRVWAEKIAKIAEFQRILTFIQEIPQKVVVSAETRPPHCEFSVKKLHNLHFRCVETWKMHRHELNNSRCLLFLVIFLANS